jgi:hypothetical protein
MEIAVSRPSIIKFLAGVLVTSCWHSLHVIASGEERHSRKRRLLKGPEEFRDIRSDLPKTKR